VVARWLTSRVPCAKRRRDLGILRGISVLEAFLENIVVLEQEFVVANKSGIHARVAAQIVKVTTQFESEIWITKGVSRVSGKSILDIMTLVCPHGSKVQVTVLGPDASEALNALAILFQTKFGEP
jgi:phosphocarrier protein HPr